MRVSATSLDGVLIIEPQIHRDARGQLAEWWHKARFAEIGIADEFVQENISWSGPGVLRGLHFQKPLEQGKLISVLHGSVFDVAVDLRRASPTFGQWVGAQLSADTMRQLYIPKGCAHGFAVLGEGAVVSYKCSAYYTPQHDRALRWNDPEIDVSWPGDAHIVSEKDANAPLLRELLEAGIL